MNKVNDLKVSEWPGTIDAKDLKTVSKIRIHGPYQ